jgi:hypothetical protein
MAGVYSISDASLYELVSVVMCLCHLLSISCVVLIFCIHAVNTVNFEIS